MNFVIRLHKFQHLMVLVLVLSACGTLTAPEPTIDVSEVQTSVYLTMLVDVTLSAPASTPTPVFTIEPTSTDVGVDAGAESVTSTNIVRYTEV